MREGQGPLKESVITAPAPHASPITAIPADASKWTEYHGEVYRCCVYLTQNAPNGFAVAVAELPTVTGAGATEADALTSVIQALRVHGKRPSPESQTEFPPRGAVVRWVVVHP